MRWVGKRGGVGWGGWLETSRKIALNGKKCAERPQRLRLYTASPHPRFVPLFVSLLLPLARPELSELAGAALGEGNTDAGARPCW